MRNGRSGARCNDDALPPPPPSGLDPAPQPYKVYRGRVSNTTRIGAFVELHGVAGHRIEGMVHISNLSTRRVSDVGEVCKRGQEVWVKVLSVQEATPDQPKKRIELSMRDVDQAGGQDLLPLQEADAAGSIGALRSVCLPSWVLLSAADGKACLPAAGVLMHRGFQNQVTPLHWPVLWRARLCGSSAAVAYRADVPHRSVPAFCMQDTPTSMPALPQAWA